MGGSTETWVSGWPKTPPLSLPPALSLSKRFTIFGCAGVSFVEASRLFLCCHYLHLWPVYVSLSVCVSGRVCISGTATCEKYQCPDGMELKPKPESITCLLPLCTNDECCTRSSPTHETMCVFSTSHTQKNQRHGHIRTRPHVAYNATTERV